MWQVGEGLFNELDFAVEAEHIRTFKSTYASGMRKLGVIVPDVIDDLSSGRVLVTEWVDGVPPRELEDGPRKDLARTAVSFLAMQLMTAGFIHCDPHEGNLLGLPDGRRAPRPLGFTPPMPPIPPIPPTHAPHPHLPPGSRCSTSV